MPTGSSPQPARLVERAQQVLRAAAGGQPDRDGAAAAERGDLPGEDHLDADVVAWGRHHGAFTREFEARQRPAMPAGVQEVGVTYSRGDERDADLSLAVARIDHGEAVVAQPHDRYRHGRVRAGDAHLVVALQLAHATTSGASRPGCSKSTCTSSQSTWYVVT